MMISNYKFSNVSGLQLFQLIRYASLIAIGILLAKSGIEQSQIGAYETFLMISGVFSVFWVQGIIKGILPKLANASKDEQGGIFFNTFLMLLSLSLISVMVLFITNKPVSRFLLHGQAMPTPVLLSIYLVLNSPAMLTEYIYLISEQPRKILKYALVIFPLQMIAVGVPPFLGHPIEVSFFGLLAVSFLRLIWFIVVLKQYKNLKINLNLIRELGQFSLPLILSTLLSSSAQYIDGFIITSKFSQAEFAIYQYGAREFPLAVLLANSLSMAMVPRFAQKEIESPLAELRSEVYRLGYFLFPLSIVMLLLSHWAFPIIFSENFSQSATIFNVYLMLLISRLLFPQPILMGKGMNGIIVRASLFETSINVVVSLWLASTIGMVGVAYGTFIAYLFEKVYLAVACYRKLNISPLKYLPLQQYLIFSLVLSTVFIFVEFIF